MCFAGGQLGSTLSYLTNGTDRQSVVSLTQNEMHELHNALITKQLAERDRRAYIFALPVSASTISVSVCSSGTLPPQTRDNFMTASFQP